MTAMNARDLAATARAARPLIFWIAIVVAVLLLGGIQAVVDRPALVHSGEGVLGVGCMLAFAGWFGYMVLLRRHHRHDRPWCMGWRRAYALLAIGLALTAVLVTISSEFTGLVFVDIGVTAMALDWPASSLPLAIALSILGEALGVPRHHVGSQLGTTLFSLALTIGIAYTIKALIRQRVERDRLIRELQDAQEQLRRSAAREVEVAGLRERNRLAREMHDTLGHALVLIAVKIEAAQRLLAVDPDRAAAEWEETKALVRSTMSELRSSLAGLRLPVLDEQPLSEALRQLPSDLSRADVAVEVAIDGAADTLERPLQEALYRVAQEALTNVAKHARARHAWLTLALRDGGVTLEVRDDGVGLNGAARTGGFGLVGMRERVESLQGVLTLGPNSGGGTVLRATLPCR
jgi:signal transduction histidine kinase